MTQAATISETTTIRVKKKTVEALENVKESLKAESLDETIQTLIKQRRKAVLDHAFGIDQGKISSFTEADRGEDRN